MAHDASRCRFIAPDLQMSSMDPRVGVRSLRQSDIISQVAVICQPLGNLIVSFIISYSSTWLCHLRPLQR